MASRYQALLTESSTYPDYLRRHFKDSAYQLRDVIAGDAGYTAIIEIFWAEGSREVFELNLGPDNPHVPELGSIPPL